MPLSTHFISHRPILLIGKITKFEEMLNKFYCDAFANKHSQQFGPAERCIVSEQE
jgi:hypothetical protein